MLRAPSLRTLYLAAATPPAAAVALPLVFGVTSTLPRQRAWEVSQGIYRAGLFALGIRVRVSGLEHYPDPARAHVLMGNHVTLFDHFVLCVALPTPIVGLEKRENFRIPLYGAMMRRWGNIPIDRGDSAQARAAVAEAAARVRSGRDWLLVFPEGTRTRDGRMGRFKKGGFHLALEAGVPVAPFALNGAWEATERPGVIEVALAPPIDTRAYTADTLEALVARTREAIASRLRTAAEA